MKSGSTVRNLIVLFLYMVLLPFIVILLPLIMGILVARNYGGWADSLSRLPGISTAGGWKSGLLAAGYVFGILLLVGTVTDGSDANSTDSALEDDASNTSANSAPSDSSEENETATSESDDPSSEDNGSESGTETDDPPASSSSGGTDERKTEEAESNEESTADSTASDAETEAGSSGEDASGTQGTDEESTSEPTSDATGADESETGEDSDTQSTASVPSEVSGGEVQEATVTRVVDGDTMEVRFANGEEETVRLIGVDTPETTLGDVNPNEYEGIPDTPAARDHLYNWGQQASQHATEELEGKEVRVVIDSEGDRRGSYGHLLAYLYVGDENFNRTLLEGGYARVYDSSFSLREEFDRTEAEARSNDVGLWDFEDDSSSSETDVSDSKDDSSSSDTDESDSDSSEDIDLPPVPADGDYDCSHFDTQEQAQYVLEDTAGDPHRLDADDDGVACETLS